MQPVNSSSPSLKRPLEGNPKMPPRKKSRVEEAIGESPLPDSPSLEGRAKVAKTESPNLQNIKLRPIPGREHFYTRFFDPKTFVVDHKALDTKEFWDDLKEILDEHEIDRLSFKEDDFSAPAWMLKSLVKQNIRHPVEKLLSRHTLYFEEESQVAVPALVLYALESRYFRTKLDGGFKHSTDHNLQEIPEELFSVVLSILEQGIEEYAKLFEKRGSLNEAQLEEMKSIFACLRHLDIPMDTLERVFSQYVIPEFSLQQTIEWIKFAEIVSPVMMNSCRSNINRGQRRRHPFSDSYISYPLREIPTDLPLEQLLYTHRLLSNEDVDLLSTWKHLKELCVASKDLSDLDYLCAKKENFGNPITLSVAVKARTLVDSDLKNLKHIDVLIVDRYRVEEDDLQQSILKAIPLMKPGSKLRIKCRFSTKDVFFCDSWRERSRLSSLYGWSVKYAKRYARAQLDSYASHVDITPLLSTAEKHGVELTTEAPIIKLVPTLEEIESINQFSFGPVHVYLENINDEELERLTQLKSVQYLSLSSPLMFDSNSNWEPNYSTKGLINSLPKFTDLEECSSFSNIDKVTETIAKMPFLRAAAWKWEPRWSKLIPSNLEVIFIGTTDEGNEPSFSFPQSIDTSNRLTSLRFIRIYDPYTKHHPKEALFIQRANCPPNCEITTWSGSLSRNEDRWAAERLWISTFRYVPNIISNENPVCEIGLDAPLREVCRLGDWEEVKRLFCLS